MNEMNEREQDAVRKSDRRAITLLRSAVEWRDKKDRSDIMDWFDGEDEFTQDDAIRAALREFDRLTAERDAARDKINAIVAWAESCDESANNPDVDADVAHDRKESVRDIYRLLGIESEASE